jgi:RNA polymerase sigma factor (sigma-70 family)
MNIEFINLEFHQRVFKKIKCYIKCNSGVEADAEDIIQDGYYIFITNIRKKEFVLTTTPDFYLFRICQNLWLKELERRRKLKASDPGSNSLIDSTAYSDILEELKKKEYQLKLIESCKEKLSKKYQEVFELRAQGRKYKEIAEIMNYSSGQIAKDKYYRGNERLKELIIESIASFRGICVEE